MKLLSRATHWTESEISGCAGLGVRMLRLFFCVANAW